MLQLFAADFNFTTLWLGLEEIDDTFQWQGRISTSISLTSELWYTGYPNKPTSDSDICGYTCRGCKLRDSYCLYISPFVCERNV